MTENLKNKYILGGIFGIILFGLILKDIRNQKNIKNNIKITNAHIYKCTKDYKGNGIYLDYTFFIKDSLIKSTDGFSRIITDRTYIFEGKTFPVAYDSTNPKNNELLLTKDRFEKYNLIFPDSLKWVMSYESD